MGRFFFLTISTIALSSCGVTNETIDGEKHDYVVDRVDTGTTVLPSNADLKMANEDLAKYAIDICQERGAEPEFARCDVFAQSDPSGAVTGYTFLLQSPRGVKVVTEWDMNQNKGRRATGCWISGTISAYTNDAWRAVPEIAEEMEGSIAYVATERTPGDFIVSEYNRDPAVEDTADPMQPNSAMGVWYFKKSGDRLRVSQERWNPCLRDASIDEVFTRVVTLTRP